ncbi:MAG: ComF family protein [Lachnospiraceae bacterium]|nr:ComF family protein [Lachnospiraceae bacterium]
MREELTHLLYPRKCPGCGIVLPAGLLVCDECAEEFKQIEEPTCLICGRHITDERTERCYTCTNSERSNIFGISIFAYDDIMKKAMSDLKFHGQTDNADFFAAMAVSRAGSRIRSFDPCALIPVPVHKSRLRVRGYNQASLLCDRIGKLLGIPVVDDFLLRTRKTGFQKNLGNIMRKRNLDGAFSCNTRDYPKDVVTARLQRVLLVDDIYTTGSTMEHCSKELVKAGVAEVGLLSISISGGT